MFASMISRLPATLRRAGAHLKAFALLEDVPARALPSAAEPDSARAATASLARSGTVHDGLPGATPAASHVHRRPPRTARERGRPRRPGAIAPRLQPCVTPLPRSARGPARLDASRPSRRGSAA